MDDPLEAEADRVAGQMMQTPAPAGSITATPHQIIRSSNANEQQGTRQRVPFGSHGTAKRPALCMTCSNPLGARSIPRTAPTSSRASGVISAACACIPMQRRHGPQALLTHRPTQLGHTLFSAKGSTHHE